MNESTSKLPSEDSSEEATESVRRLLEKRSKLLLSSWSCCFKLADSTARFKLPPRRWFCDAGKFLPPTKDSLTFRFMIAAGKQVLYARILNAADAIALRSS